MKILYPFIGYRRASEVYKGKKEESLSTEILHRFFAGECTPTEAHQLLIWINTPNGEKEFKKVFDAYEEHAVEKSNQPLKSDELLSKIHNKIKDETLVKSLLAEQGTPEFKLNEKPVVTFNWFRIAAVVALLITCCSAAYFLVRKDYQPVKEVAVEMLTKKAEPGQKLTIHLSDGSVAVLNANSSITYPREFASDIRKIQMEGEVFFDVAKSKTKPFVVSTSRMNTTALGTSFNINARTKDLQEVSLITGKVKVELIDGNDVKFLMPGEEIRYAENQMIKEPFNVQTKTLWKDGVIFFDNRPLAECFETLESWYGIKIEIKGQDRSKGRMVSGRFDNDYLGNVLNSISYAHNFDYKVSEERVHITFTR
ncbi:MAG: FecR domain-containing protein [Marinoscillum sp.]